jgi:hypothetical protein
MKPESEQLVVQLEANLEDLIRVYRHLLGVVRREKEILILAQLNELNENNKAKELTLLKAKELEESRMKIVKDLAIQENLTGVTKLLDFAREFGGEVGERLRRLHSVLDLLLKRVREHNQMNEKLVKSALENITGAIGSIRDTLKDKPTYKKGGAVTQRPAESGQLVSKEV